MQGFVILCCKTLSIYNGKFYSMVKLAPTVTILVVQDT